MLSFNQKLNKISQKLDKISKRIEAHHMVDYYEVAFHMKGMIWKNFVIGIAKGIGIALGFSVIGGLIIYLLRKIVMLNLPVIGALIRDVMSVVEELQEIK